MLRTAPDPVSHPTGGWTVTTIPEGAGVPEAVITRLARDYRYPAYRHWRGFGAETPRQLLAWELAHGHEEPVRHWRVLISQSPDVLGLAWIVSRPWESQQLGHTMGALRHLVVVAPTEAARREATQALLRASAAQAQEDLECVSHSLDVDDWASIAALQLEGFRLMDTLVSFLCCERDVLTHMARRLRRRGVVRPGTPEDAGALEAIARACHFGGRYYHDPQIPREVADRLYAEWVRQCSRRVFADELFVGVRRGAVVGFLAYRVHRALQAATGIRLGAQGLLAVLPQHKGVALEILQGGIEAGSASVDFGQFDIHLENTEFFGLLCRTLRMRVARVQHTFHRWLGAPGR